MTIKLLATLAACALVGAMLAGCDPQPASNTVTDPAVIGKTHATVNTTPPNNTPPSDTRPSAVQTHKMGEAVIKTEPPSAHPQVPAKTGG
jgi:uncharacterized lipoprotein YajG